MGCADLPTISNHFSILIVLFSFIGQQRVKYYGAYSEEENIESVRRTYL